MLFDESTRLSDAQAELQMYPRPGSTYGFLAPGESLAERRAADAKQMTELDLDCERIAARIDDVFSSTGDSWNGHALLRPTHIAGMLCPWKDFLSSDVFSMSLSVREIIIVHREKIDQAIAIMQRYPDPSKLISLESYGELVKADVAMILSDLHPHLLRVHAFCEGTDTPYRLAPDRIREYLGDL